MGEITAAILIFAVGWLATLLYDRQKKIHEENLNRVNHQIRDLYGPLLAGIRENEAAWKLYAAHFNKKFPDSLDDNHRDKEWPYQPKDPKLDEWVRWNRIIFQPINDRMRKVIEENSDLFYDDEVSKQFYSFIDHVISWKAIISQWDVDDFSEISAVNKYPDKLRAHVRSEYKKLRVRQKKLLGKSFGVWFERRF